MKWLNKKLALGLSSVALLACNAPAQITLDYRYVGNPGNAADTTGYGAVSYAYAISTFEVTLSQYATFLNSVAKTDGSVGLWNGVVQTDLNIRGIVRTGSNGSRVYTVQGDGTRPVTYLSWYDAARFVNWMHNGQPVGAQGPLTTEGGAYTMTGISGFPTRNVGWKFALPSESEWYKAAYHQPESQGRDSDNYWLYPTASNVIPNSRNGSASDPNSANFYRDDAIANGYNDGYAVSGSPTYSSSQNYLTPVGAFSSAASFYGTFDQGGNVREWTEGLNGATHRVVRGGAWNSLSDATLSALNRNPVLPVSEVESIGFRIITVPEPSTGGLLALGMALLAWKRKQAR